LEKNFGILDAVAGPDGEDATLSSKPFESFKTTSAELPKEKRKIIIGLPDVRIIFPYLLFLHQITYRITI